MTIFRKTRAPTILSLCISDHGLPSLSLLLLLLHTLPPSSAQLPNIPSPPPPDPFSRFRFDKTMAIILVILVLVFFVLGFLSVYSRRCAERRIRGTLDPNNPNGSSRGHPRGLDPEIIHTFPTFVYSTVKGLKIGKSTLECAVCINEFQDDETLRFIPKCSHVFHPDCIDLWLSSHSTCPVCRANLVPRPGDVSFVAIQIPDAALEPDRLSDSDDQQNRDIIQLDDNGNRVAGSPKVNLLSRSKTTRSGSTGFRIGSLFPRSHSTGHSLVPLGENRERFTLRLPEEVRKELLNSTLNRTKSCVTFTRMSSERRGYRTRSVGSRGGRNEERWGFTLTPPFINRSGSSSRKPPVARDNLGERSSDQLRPDRDD